MGFGTGRSGCGLAKAMGFALQERGFISDMGRMLYMFCFLRPPAKSACHASADRSQTLRNQIRMPISSIMIFFEMVKIIISVLLGIIVVTKTFSGLLSTTTRRDSHAASTSIMAHKSFASVVIETVEVRNRTSAVQFSSAPCTFVFNSDHVCTDRPPKQDVPRALGDARGQV